MVHVDLDVPRALELLEEVVNEKGPDFVYKVDAPPGVTVGACTYVHYVGPERSRAPGCLVGHVLFKAGVDLYDMEELDRYGAVGACAHRGALQIDAGALTVLAAAQGLQDREQSWGAALDGARRAAEAWDA